MIMNKYQNNTLVEEMDDIILLNDNYADKGLFKGYIGEVMENLIEERGFVVADFSIQSRRNIFNLLWRFKKKISVYFRIRWLIKNWSKNLRICLEINNLLGSSQC